MDLRSAILNGKQRFSTEQGPVDFSVTIRLVSLPGFYWTYGLCRHPKHLVQNPLLGWSRREITKRTYYLLSWSLVGEDGLDQKEIYIGFVFVSADCLADVHGHYRCQNTQ